jgi:alcohol dehydrogenase class IV
LFKCPTLYYGRGSLDRLATLKAERVLLVTDKQLVKMGLVTQAEKRLRESAKETKVFDDIEPDPKDTTVANCVAVAEEFEPDLIIGFGGGSSIDVAKATYFRYERPDVPLCDMSPMETYGLGKKSRLVAVPTTSGTGSEAGLGCVITDSESGRKLSLACFELTPDTAILDPDLASKMPPKLRATTGIDVLAHAIESYICNMRNYFSDALAAKAIQTVFQCLENSFKTDDEEATEKMHYAATYAGIAMNNSGLGLAHGIGHSIGAVYHIPHGAAVGFALPYAIEYCAETSKDRYLEILKMIGIEGTKPENSTRKLSAMVRELMTKIQLSTTIKGLSIKEDNFRENLPKVAEFSESDPTSYTSPRNATKEDITRILEYMIKNNPIDF